MLTQQMFYVENYSDDPKIQIVDGLVVNLLAKIRYKENDYICYNVKGESYIEQIDTSSNIIKNDTKVMFIHDETTWRLLHSAMLKEGILPWPKN